MSKPMDACSPVPAYTVAGFEGANASEPIASDAFWSPTAVHVTPASVERQMPPCAPPMSTVFPVVSLGSTAMVVILPVTGLNVPPVVGVGPIEVHAGKEVEPVCGVAAA